MVLGPTTNTPLHQWILGRADFQQGAVDTGWLERVWPTEYDEVVDPTVGVLAVLVEDQRSEAAKPNSAPSESSDGMSAWAKAGRLAGLQTR